MVLIGCCECSNSFKDVVTYNMHMRINHPKCRKFQCKMDNCNRSYSLWYTLSKHLVTVHSVPRRASEVAQPPVHLPVVHDVVDNHVDVGEVGPSIAEGIPIDAIPANNDCDLKGMLVKQQDVLVAKLYAHPGFPRNLVDKMVKDFSHYLSSPFFDSFEDLVLDSLSSDTSLDKKLEIEQMFVSIMSPFEHLSTEHRRFSYFKQSGHYIKPEPYTIIKREERAKRKSNMCVMMKDVEGQAIPLKLVLKKFFELPNALNDTLDFMKSLEENNDWICNFTQCAIWQRKLSRFNENDIVMPLNFYYDECEANNPLGPHADPMGCSYVHIPCLPEDWSSRLENIFLALLFDADDRTVYGNKRVFKPALKEMKQLETEGVTVRTVELGNVKVFFVLGALLGDNKALNGICGFVEGFTANYYCRVCCCHRDKAYNLFVEDPDCLRTLASYENDVLMNDSLQTGIKEKCIFSEITSFEMPTDVCVDEFHDVIEGVAHYTMLPVLNHFHKMNRSFLSTLNNRLYCIDLGIDNDNRPPLIHPDRLSKDKLKMTGAEMYTFVRIFGVLVKDMVPENDRFYELYLLLHDIVSLTHAKGLPRDSAECFKSTVEQHHKLYVELTKETFKPKHHFLVHYWRLFLLFGPFGPLSTLRFKAKHRVLKMTCNTCGSRRNLSKTVAIKQQLGLCYRSISNCSPRSAMSYGPVTFVDLRDLEEYAAFSTTLPDTVLNEPVQKLTKWVDYKGTKYEPRQVLLTGSDDFGLFTFSELKMIILLEDRPLFICSPFESIGYYSEVRGYQVKHNSAVLNWFALEQGKLLDHHPLCLYLMSTGENVIVLKYVI